MTNIKYPLLIIVLLTTTISLVIATTVYSGNVVGTTYLSSSLWRVRTSSSVQHYYMYVHTRQWHGFPSDILKEDYNTSLQSGVISLVQEPEYLSTKHRAIEYGYIDTGTFWTRDDLSKAAAASAYCFNQEDQATCG